MPIFYEKLYLVFIGRIPTWIKILFTGEVYVASGMDENWELMSMIAILFFFLNSLMIDL